EAGLEVVRLLAVRNLRLPPLSRNWAEVLDALAALPEAQRNSAGAVVIRAEVLAITDKADDARRLLETARAKDPKEKRYWLALAGLAERRGQSAEAART